MANTTQEFIDALKEADKVAFIKSIIPKGDKGDTGAQGAQGAKGDDGAKGADGTLAQADKDKLALIDGTTAINFDEVILDGDRASVSDIDDPNAVPATLERFISIAGLRHGLTQFGKVMATTYEHLLGNPTKDDQILSSKKDGTRSWIDAPSGGGTPSADVLLRDGSVKAIDHLDIGDRSGEAQVTLDAKAKNASHVVFSREGVPKSSIGVSAANNDELIIEQRAGADIRFIVPVGQTVAAKVGGEWHDLLELARPTVVAAYSATPTKAELIAAIKTVPHFNDWESDMDFYLRDDPQTKMLLVKYRGVTGNTEASSGLFFFEKLTKAT